MVTASISHGPIAAVPGQAIVVLAGAVGFVLVGVAGAWLVRRNRAPAARARRAGALAAAARTAAGRLPHPAAAAVVALAAGIVAAVTVTWAAGLLARSGMIVHADSAVSQFVAAHRVPGMSRLMGGATLLGSYPVISAIALTAGVMIGAQSGRWFPLLTLIGAEAAEYLLQRPLGALVHLAKPRQATAVGPVGAYFSGGSARVVLICGLLVYFLGWTGAEGRRRAFLWISAALAAFTEGYSRLYLGRHWMADIFGGWLFGVVTLAAFVIAAGALRPAQEPVAAVEREATMAPDISRQPAGVPPPRGGARENAPRTPGGGER